MVSLLKKSTAFLFSEQTSILSAATLIGSFSVLSAFFGVVYKRLLVSTFSGGDRYLLDAFFTAFRIPDLLFSVFVVGVLSATFIPIYTKILAQKNERDEFVWSLLTILSIVYSFFAILIGTFAKESISLFVGSEFTPEQLELSASLMRMLFVAQFFFLLSNFLSGILQSNKKFLLPALAPVLYNCGIIVGILLFSQSFGIYAPAIGVLIGSLAHFAIQLPFVYRYGFSYRFQVHFSNPHIREVFRLMLPRSATQATNSIEDLAGVYIATSFGTTLLTSITLAQTLIAAPIRFFGVSIAQAALPFLSSEAKEHDVAGFVSVLMQTLHQIAFFMYPMAALLLVLRIPIVRLAFGSKELLWKDTVLLGQLVAIYALSVGIVAMIHVLLRAFYALKETWMPFFIASIAMCIHVVVLWVGAHAFHLGVYAIPIGFVIASIVEAILLVFFLFSRLKLFYWKEFFFTQAKIGFAALLTGVVLYSAMKFLDRLVFDTTRVFGLLALTGLTSAAGFFVYFLVCWILNVEQLSIVRALRGKIIDWKKRLAASEETLGVDSDIS